MANSVLGWDFVTILNMQITIPLYDVLTYIHIIVHTNLTKYFRLIHYILLVHFWV